MTPGELALFAAAFVAELRERDATLRRPTVGAFVESAHAAAELLDGVIQRAPAAMAALEARAQLDDSEAILASRTLFRLRELLR